MNIPTGRDLSSMQGRVIDSFDSRSYYSGADVRFEFGDIPVRDVTYISWKVVEPIKYHYGYASRYRLRTSRGVRMVSGQIGMNFRDPFQMQRLLKQLKQNKNSTSEVIITETTGSLNSGVTISETTSLNNGVSIREITNKYDPNVSIRELTNKYDSNVSIQETTGQDKSGVSIREITDKFDPSVSITETTDWFGEDAAVIQARRLEDPVKIVETTAQRQRLGILRGNLQSKKLTPEQVARNLQSQVGGETASEARAKLEVYRDVIWGKLSPKTSGTPSVHDTLYNNRTNQSSSTKSNVLDPYLYAHELAQGGGIDSGEGTRAKYLSIPGGFNIRLIFGEPDGIGFAAKADQAGRQIGAIHLLNGVEIMSSSMEVTETGEPLRMLYEFSAADVF